MQLKDIIKCEAIDNILKAKTARYERLAAQFKEATGHIEDFKEFEPSIAKTWHKERTLKIYQEAKEKEDTALLNDEIINFFMMRHNRIINDELFRAQHIDDYNEKEAVIKEVEEALKVLPEIELLYSDFAE